MNDRMRPDLGIAEPSGADRGIDEAARLLIEGAVAQASVAAARGSRSRVFRAGVVAGRPTRAVRAAKSARSGPAGLAPMRATVGLSGGVNGGMGR